MKKYFVLFFVFVLLTSMACNASSYPRWNFMPLHVYVPQNGKYSELMRRAFNMWHQKSNGLVRFKYVNKVENADIYVDFVDYVKDCGSESAVGCAQNTIRKNLIVKSRIEIGMRNMPVLYKDKNGKVHNKASVRSNDHLYGVMIHEIGHALGLGHSQNVNSIMYPIDRNELQHITSYDLKLITEKYK